MLNNNLSVKSIQRPEAMKLPKIVGDIRHYPPANKEWKNSIYAYNKNSLKSLPALDKIATKTIKSYFNLSDNKKLARSKRMRNLIRRRTVKRLFASKPEIKQTSDKVNITVYTFNRERQFFVRKMYFYHRNMNINKDIYLYKLWLKKNLLAFKKTFKGKKSIKLLKKNKITKTIRKNKNKTYIHNILLKRYLRKDNGHSPLSLFKQISFTKQKKHGVRSLITSNLLKSLKKRNLIRLLKKREEKKRSSGIHLEMVPSKKKNFFLKEKSPYLVPINNLHKTFNNYLIQKVSRKINFKLRNLNSIVKIQQKLKKIRRFRFNKIRVPYSNLKFKNEIKFFSFKLVSELKYIRKLFIFYFIKYLLSLLQIKINISRSGDNVSNNNNLFDRLKYELIIPKNIENKNKKVKKIVEFKNRYSYDKLKNIELLNLELLNFLKLTLSESKTNHFKGNVRSSFNAKASLYTIPFNKENIDSLYKKFENNYFLIFLAKFFKKEFLYINYYSKFLINQLKFGKFLPGLKLFISKIYSKKVELNLVNLKYSHLNSDIYAESIATKLKKKIGLLRVLRWSLKLARLPYNYVSNNNTTNLNKLHTLNIHKSLDINALCEKKNQFILNSSEDRLDEVLNKLYPHLLAHGHSLFSKQTSQKQFNSFKVNQVPSENGQALKSNVLPLPKNLSILNIIKYKWVSGVRLEAAGRLTRRYTAARSVFKFRYKGSLRNIDYSQKIDTTKKNISTVMLRNHVKSNSQYSFTKSKRRIGAFGLKAWIASY